MDSCSRTGCMVQIDFVLLPGHQFDRSFWAVILNEFVKENQTKTKSSGSAEWVSMSLCVRVCKSVCACVCVSECVCELYLLFVCGLFQFSYTLKLEAKICVCTRNRGKIWNSMMWRSTTLLSESYQGEVIYYWGQQLSLAISLHSTPGPLMQKQNWATA